MLRSTQYLATGLALVATVACGGAKTENPVVTSRGGDSVASPSGTQMAKEGKSLVRLVNAIPGKNAIDISGADRTVFTAIGYQGVTSYAEIRDNRVDFRLRSAGTDSALATNHEMMTDGYRYTIVALPGEKGEPLMRILRDEVVPDSGKTRIRVINASPDIGNVDVAMQGAKTPLFANVHYGAEAGYTDMMPMNGTVEVRSDVKTRKPLLIKNLHFEAGKAYTIVLAGWGTGVINAIMFDDTMTGGNLVARN